MSYSYDRRPGKSVQARLINMSDLYSDMDPKLLKVWSEAKKVNRAAHDAFGDTKHMVRDHGADGWRDVIGLYDKAIRLWNDVWDLAHRKDYIFRPGNGIKETSMMDEASRLRRICIDRRDEAKERFEKALRKERDEGQSTLR